LRENYFGLGVISFSFLLLDFIEFQKVLSCIYISAKIVSREKADLLVSSNFKTKKATFEKKSV
jgi:hypothetical protein